MAESERIQKIKNGIQEGTTNVKHGSYHILEAETLLQIPDGSQWDNLLQGSGSLSSQLPSPIQRMLVGANLETPVKATGKGSRTVKYDLSIS